MYWRAIETMVKMAVIEKLLAQVTGSRNCQATNAHVRSATKKPIAVLVTASMRLSARH